MDFGKTLTSQLTVKIIGYFIVVCIVAVLLYVLYKNLLSPLSDAKKFVKKAGKQAVKGVKAGAGEVKKVGEQAKKQTTKSVKAGVKKTKAAGKKIKSVGKKVKLKRKLRGKKNK